MKHAVIIGLAIVTLAATAAGLWVFGRPAYRKYRETTAATRATEFLAARRYNEASLCARQALTYNPSNLQACLVMARLLELAQKPQLLDWRRRIVRIAPTLENKLALATAALQTQPPPFPLARQIIEELAPTAANSADYHAVAAQLALRLERQAEAAEHFQQACRLKPESEQLRLNLAVLRLGSTNQAKAEAGRSTLEGLRGSTNVGALALRWLVLDRMNHKQPEAAEQLSRELLGAPGCVFEDRLQHLSILQSMQAPSFGAALAGLQGLACTNSATIQVTAAWMINHGLAEAAALWISNCPPKVRAEYPVSQALADCYVARKDWAGLEQFLQEQKWGEGEFLRYGFLSLAAERQNQPVGAQSRWRSAVREAGDRLGPLMALFRLSAAWGRQEGADELLWAIVQRFPSERWALAELERVYVRGRNTRGLYKVYTAMAAYDPSNFVLKNNLASTALLLGMNLPKAHEQAVEVFKEHPENPVVASTYAFSLHLQGKHSESLKALTHVPPEALEKPPVCLYYGVALAAAGQRAQAGKYLAACQSDDLLPEERVLLTEALAR